MTLNLISIKKITKANLCKIPRQTKILYPLQPGNAYLYPLKTSENLFF